VRSACATADSLDSAGKVRDGRYTLALYCIDALLDTIHALSALDRDGEAPAPADDRLHRLHLTLISTVPTLPLKLLPRVLEEIRSTFKAYGSADSGSAKMKDLVDAIFVEISERVGDREKEFVMRWWYENRESFLGGRERKARVGLLESRL
jgi:hypothetical protein